MEQFNKYSGCFSIETDSGNIQILDHNTITTLFEEIVATVGVDQLVSKASPINAGKTYFEGACGKNANRKAWSDDGGKQLITVYLLNLSPAEKAALSSDTYILPIYSSDFLSIDQNKIVGYATARVNPLASNKEGHIIPHSGALLVNNRRHGLAWRFEAGSVSGTFNTIAVGLNCIDSNYLAGVRLARSLDLKSILGGDYENAYDYFMIPNVKNTDGTVVWTGEDEILLGGKTSSDYNVARVILNLATGELTSLDISDVRYGLELYKASETMQYVFGDYLITCTSTPTYRSGNTVYATNINTGSKNSVYYSSYCVQGFFTYNGYLYACGQNTASSEFTAYAYDSSMNSVSSANLTMTLPSSWSYSECIILPYGSNYILVHSTDTSYIKPSEAQTLVFTNPENIGGSIIGVLPGIQPTCCITYNNDPYFFDSENHNSNQSDYDRFEESLYYSYMNGSDTTNIKQNGLKFYTLGMFGNLFSFKTYDEDMEISAGDGIKVSYWYTFDQ